MAEAKEEKSRTNQRKSQPLPGIPKVPKEKEQKTRLPLMRTVHGTPKRAGHLAVGKGWSGGVFTRPLGRKDPPGPAPGIVQSSEAAPGHFHSQPPAHRQVLALPGAPAGLCAARASQSADGGRDSCGRWPGGGRAQGEREAPRAGARGREGRAETEGTQPAPAPACRRSALGIGGAQATAPPSQKKERDPLRGPCP